MKATNSPYGSFSEYTRLNPYVKYKDEDGNYIYELEAEDRRSNTGSYKFFIYNPLYNTTLDVRDESRYNDLTNLFGIDWQIIEGLRLKGSFSFTLQNTSCWMSLNRQSILILLLILVTILTAGAPIRLPAGMCSIMTLRWC